tara:strand:+ start:3450 stop:6479 length:3030 start_codon:yes stop_codon:yes gene_type:complete
MILAVLLVFGGVSYFTLPAREDPEITIREAIVTTSFPGLNPERVENLITKKLEREIRKIPEIKEIRSTSLTGESIIHVEIEDRYFDLDLIWQDLRNKITRIHPNLPEGTQPSFVNDEFGDVSVITLALTSDGFTIADMNDMAKHIRDTLYSVKGTKKIDVLGVQEERIFLEISNAKLARLVISPNELVSILQNQNIIRPGGSVDTGSKNFIIEPTGNFETLSDIEKTLISLPGSEEVIPLGDIVSLKKSYIDPPFQTAYYNGKPAIMFAISMLSGYNVLEFSPRMKARIDAVEETLPTGYQLDVATYQAEAVSKTVTGVSWNVLQTLLIVLVVVILFLGIRTGLIVGTIVPFVMLVTLALMNVFNISLERMSLSTLIIALGLLVDNGIVIAEDFKRRLEEGSSRDVAMKESGKELAIPLLVSSLTTILVFLPLMLAEHVAGEYTRSISLVILISLMTSWLMALCITPTLCYYFLKITPLEKTTPEKIPLKEKFFTVYRTFLVWSLRHRKLFLSLMTAAFIGSIALMTFVPKQFFPDSDRAQILLYVELPSDTSARTTNRRMKDIFTWLHKKERFPHVTSFTGYAGFGGPRFVLSLSPDDPADNKGFIALNIDDLDHVESTMKKLRKGFQQNFPDLFVRVTRMFLGPSDSSKLEVQVIGPDADILYDTAKNIKALFASIPHTTDIRTNWENRTTKILVEVNQQQARRAGVTSADIALTMQSYFDGMQVTKFRQKDEIIPIIMRADAEERFNLDRIRSMNVFSSARGTNVPLFQIATFSPMNQYARIERQDLFRTITIEAKNLNMTAEDLKMLVDPKLKKISETLPLNHSIAYDGVIKDSARAQKALAANVPLVIGIILVLLVFQFNSFRRPLIIVMTIPLAIIGASLGLILTGSFFGFMVTLGLYSLAGIIVNNAIVLIDRIDIERAFGKDPIEAIISACLLRLRPIVMTTVTTILGLMPLIISRDPLFYGMSNTMAFGLGIGTILTLGVVPVLYAVLFRINKDKISTQD